MKLFGFDFGAKVKAKRERREDLQREWDHINNAMPVAISEMARLKKNKKSHLWMAALIKDHRTRQLEIERELNA